MSIELEEKKPVKKSIKFYSRYDRPEHKDEITSPVDNVDRSGYIPLDIQYYRMISAGGDLEAVKDYKYNVDMEALNNAISQGLDIDISKIAGLTIKNKMDKNELNDLFVSKMKQYKAFRNRQEEIEAHKKVIEAQEKDKAIRQNAINEMKQFLRDKGIDMTSILDFK